MAAAAETKTDRAGEPPSPPAPIVLASTSVHRLQLLRQIGIDPVVMDSEFEENLPKTLPPDEFVLKTARGKLEAVRNRIRQSDYAAVIACDTVLWFENGIIGKPTDLDDARRTLERLSGKSHDIYSGVCVLWRDGRVEEWFEKSTVQFVPFTRPTIDWYIGTKEPLGRAGSYGIQGKGAVLVEGVTGCFYSVVGLPLHRLHRRLREERVIPLQ